MNRKRSKVKKNKTKKRTNDKAKEVLLGLTAAGAAAALAVLITVNDGPTISGTTSSPSRQPVTTAHLTASVPAQIPVLCFHNIGTPSATAGNTDNYSVTLANFTAEMAWLHQHGYTTITVDQYTNWLAGVPQALPAKPVLITFDDLFTADLTKATPVLKKYGFHAVGFVVTGYADGAYLAIDNGTDNPQTGPNAYALWADIKSYASGGTWTFQFHAGLCGHAYLPYAPASCLTGLNQAEMNNSAFQYYIWNFGQTDAQYETRVSAETTAGLTDLGTHLGVPGFQSALFAAPFGAWGDGDNPWLLKYWDSKYDVVFVQYIAQSDESTAHADRVRYRLELGYGAQSASYLSSHINDPAFTRAGSNGTTGSSANASAAGQ